MRFVTQRIVVAILVVLAALPFGQATQAQEAQPRSMSIVDMINIPDLSGAHLSPDGTQVVYVKRTADWKENNRIAHIWRANLAGGPPHQLTNGEDGESSPLWSPDGKHIAFLAKRGDDKVNQIYLLPASGGEAFRLTNHGTAVSDVSWSPDGQYLFFRASDERTKEEKKKRELKDDVYAFDEDYKHQHLWRVDREGKETRLTEGEFSVTDYSVSRDGSQVVLQRGSSPLLGISHTRELWIMASDGTGARVLTNNNVSESGARLSPDNQWVLFTLGTNEAFEPYYNDKIFLLPTSGSGSMRRLLAKEPFDVGQASWSADGKSILFSANTGVRQELFRVEVANERLTRLTTGDHQVQGWHYRPELDQHVFAIEHAQSPGDLWSLKGSGKPTQITHEFDALAKTFLLPRQEAIRWKGEDGQEVEGLLYYPLDYEAGKRYPLVVQTHGGPAASDKFGFGTGTSSYIPILAAKGYLVFRPNYRGSTGYGDAFYRDMVGHYFHQAHLDVMTGVDHLIAQGLADPDRMIKMGWSAGGHMTNKIITHTGRFKAAASGAGASNWLSMYAQTDIRNHRSTWFGGAPWDENAPVDKYWQDSPLREAWKVTTPTLFLVGEEDERVPMPQSVEMYRALKHRGVPTHLYVAPRQPHGWRELRHILFKVNVELDWFERWAMDREYTWEEAPETK